MSEKQNETPKIYQNIEVKDGEKSTKEITGEISAEAMKEKRAEALGKLADEVEVEGFRKGYAPKDMVEKKVGAQRILEEASQNALSEAYPQILSEYEIKAIGQPKISITKIAPDNPLGFSIVAAVLPEFKVADYKKISEDERKNSDKEEIIITENEVDETIKQIRQNIAIQEKQKTRQELSGDNPAEPIKAEDLKDEDLPELNDDLAKRLGEFKNLEDLKTKLKENLKREKELHQKEKLRTSIAEKLIEKTRVDLPDILVDSELQKMFAQFKDDVSRSGMEWNDYLEKLGKKEEDLRKEWRPSAEKKAKFQLILNKIASEEGLQPDKEMYKNEVNRLKEHYPQANDQNIRVYVETILINEEVFKMLEGRDK